MAGGPGGQGSERSARLQSTRKRAITSKLASQNQQAASLNQSINQLHKEPAKAASINPITQEEPLPSQRTRGEPASRCVTIKLINQSHKESQQKLRQSKLPPKRTSPCSRVNHPRNRTNQPNSHFTRGVRTLPSPPPRPLPSRRRPAPPAAAWPRPPASACAPRSRPRRG